MTTDNLGELAERLRHLAQVPVLLVACDYDGTLAPFSDDPMNATPDRDSVAAMRSLAEQANTHVTVISGRSLRDLATLSRLPEEIRLVGSHGSEFDLGFASDLDPALSELRRQVVTDVESIARRYNAVIEEKPAGVTFHFRTMAEADAEAAREELIHGPASHPEIHVRNGHHVLEFSVISTNKGSALQSLRHQVGASAVVFIGDDLTDEDAFRTLSGPDVGVKVGEAKTAAGFRVPSTSRVAQLLALLAELRSRWLRGAGLDAIEDHSILSDLRTVAVVAPDAAISWLCLPRVDSGAVFARLLGGQSAGHFTIRGGSDGTEMPDEQRYLKRTCILESRFPQFTVTDFLDTSEGRSQRLAGRSDLHRTLEGVGPATIEFAPRPDFGRVPSRLQVETAGIVVQATTDPMVLHAPDVHWELRRDGPHDVAVGRVDLAAGHPVSLVLRSGVSTIEADPRSPSSRRSDTTRFWSDWVDSLELPSIERELVARSAIVLKSLTYRPTGAIVSAATMSLPQVLGGVRNWDYRYCWLRDAAQAAAALARLGSTAEGVAYLDWVSQLLQTRSQADRLAPLYNVTGRHLSPEAEIADLPGYGGSRPVRVGNAAERQIQLDGFGAIVDLIHHLVQRGQPMTTDWWRLIDAVVLAVARRWRQPDHGIWHSRREPQHYVHSKVMSWVAVDRAIAMADQSLDREPTAWIELRDRLATDIIEQGWNPAVGAFTAAFGSTDLDASALAVGLWGLLPAEDERFTSTVAAIDRELRSGPTVYRYRHDDGLPGQEGGFNLTTSWLIEALCLTGHHERANTVFKGLCGLAGPTGLLSEQFDPDSGRSLGNIPSSTAHAGLISNALALDGIL